LPLSKCPETIRKSPSVAVSQVLASITSAASAVICRFFPFLHLTCRGSKINGWLRESFEIGNNDYPLMNYIIDNNIAVENPLS
jgi:hypothetical protein